MTISDEVRQRADESRMQREKAVEKLVYDIQEAREEITLRIDSLYRLAVELRTLSRRSFDEGSQSYVVFANAHLRLAGALSQGVRRTGSTDRILKVGQTEREDARRRDEMNRQREQVQEHRKVIDKLALSTDNAFDEVYGEFLSKVNHAQP